MVDSDRKAASTPSETTMTSLGMDKLQGIVLVGRRGREGFYASSGFSPIAARRRFASAYTSSERGPLRAARAFSSMWAGFWVPTMMVSTLGWERVNRSISAVRLSPSSRSSSSFASSYFFQASALPPPSPGSPLATPPLMMVPIPASEALAIHPSWARAMAE